jgi:curli biogenesis system outer membrane secretion channel CsgG
MTVKLMSPIFLVFAGLLVTSPALAQDTAIDRPVVTIAPFDTGRTGWVPPSGFGQSMAERLGQRLVESGHYRVLDSELLMSEGAAGGRPGAASLLTWRDCAERAGVSYLLIGSVTRYSKEERRRSGGGATTILQLIVGARFHLPLAGAGRSTRTDSIIGVSVRMIDVHTGEIVTIANGEGIASRTDRAGGGFGAIYGAPIAGGYADSRSGAATAMLDEAVRQAVDQAGETIAKAATTLPR